MKRLNANHALVIVFFALTELVYLRVFSLPFPLTRLYATIPPLDYAKLTNHSAAGLLAFTGGIIVLFIIYCRLLTLPALRRLVPYSALVFAATLLFSYPVMAIDLFVYALHGRGWGLYGLNPLATPPGALPPADPWIRLAAEWADNSSPYGPVWEALNAGAFHLTGGNFLWHLLALKGLAVLSYLACIYLIGQILQQIKPDWRIGGMTAFAWNPLVLFETAQNGHNDILMMAFLLAALWAMINRRTGLSVLGLALSVLVKFITAPLAPLVIFYLSRKQPTRARRIGFFVAWNLLFAALVILPMLPLWPGMDQWAVLKANNGAGRSVLALCIMALEPWLGLNPAFTAGRWLVTALFLALTLYFWAQKRRQFHQPETLIFMGWAFYFWYVLLVAPVFHGWYVLWFLPLAILLPRSEPFYASLVFCLTALLIIPYFETIRVWFPVLLSNSLFGHLLGAPLLTFPPALVALKKRAIIYPAAG